MRIEYPSRYDSCCILLVRLMLTFILSLNFIIIFEGGLSKEISEPSSEFLSSSRSLCSLITTVCVELRFIFLLIVVFISYTIICSTDG
jgi:hypothetical protein